MKNIRIFFWLVAFGAIMLTSCKNFGQDFPDYEYDATYFPYQYPFRTLILGDDEQVDTTPDNEGKFKIGLTMGGVYSNTKSRKVEYVYDETLAENLYSSTNVELSVLPRSYYNFSDRGTITIPKGSMQGYLDIELNDAFFDDPDTHTLKYVIPLRIATAETDSVLCGVPAHPNADSRIDTDWYVTPRDFTIYAIKYINPWHGTYLHRGRDTYGNSNVVVYRNKYVERSEVRTLSTMSKNQTGFTTPVRSADGTSPGNLSLVLTFDSNNKCVVTSNPNSYATVTGDGAFVKAGDEWGGKKRNVLHLDYKFTDPATNELHEVKDTLVVRDRNVRLEVFSPVVR